MNVRFNMKKITDYGKVFDVLVKRTEDYICSNNLKCMVLGISGGIDSTVVAAICHEVSKRTGVPLIGRSLPTKHNKEGEKSTALMVGKAFCNDFKEVSIKYPYDAYLDFLEGVDEDINPIADGNIQARLRMIYLYNLASVHRGLVMDTDNLTENNLGYFTIHGDVGDFNPIGGLWKTEVFKLAEWLFNEYKNNDYTYLTKAEAMWASLQLKPTAGLGITDSDLDEIGAESYDQVDAILQEILAWKTFNRDNSIIYANKKDEKEAFLNEQQMLTCPIEIISAVASRHFSSEFKRAKLPVVIERISYLI